MIERNIFFERTEKNGSGYPVSYVYVNEKEATALEFGQTTLNLTFQAQNKTTKTKKRAHFDISQKSTSDPTNKLRHLLCELRATLSREKNIPAYLIFYNDTIDEMVNRLPTTLSEFKQINGVGDFKLAKYGPAFIKVISEWVAKNPSSNVPLYSTNPVISSSKTVVTLDDDLEVPVKKKRSDLQLFFSNNKSASNPAPKVKKTFSASNIQINTTKSTSGPKPLYPDISKFAFSNNK